VPVDEDIDTFMSMFETYRYARCENGEAENGFSKLAIYVKPDGITVAHAARQLKNGLWSSKLGQNHDIQHGTPYTMEGVLYGQVAVFMKKTVTQ
jgi:hypothetical protein